MYIVPSILDRLSINHVHVKYLNTFYCFTCLLTTHNINYTVFRPSPTKVKNDRKTFVYT